MTLADWRTVAAQRRALARSWGVARAYSQDNEEIGAACEWAFAVEFNLAWDGHVGSGDKGIDFEVFPFTIDVKGAADASAGSAFLLHEVAGPQSRQSTAAILVAARYDRSKQAARLIGWHWRSAVEKCAVREFGAKHRDGSPVASHAMPIGWLHPISTLHRELGR